jgi:hypothetical protein
MMNSEYKQKWVDALTSGGYEQGNGFLRQGNKFCCLGVLCDIVDPEGWGVRGRGMDGIICYRYLDGEWGLPKAVQAEVGVDEFAALPGARAGETLAGLNDNGASFDDIAKVIEAKF